MTQITIIEEELKQEQEVYEALLAEKSEFIKNYKKARSELNIRIGKQKGKRDKLRGKLKREQRNDMKGKELAEKIFIRAKVNAKWGSYSLQELLNLGEKGKVLTWIIQRKAGSELIKVTGVSHLPFNDIYKMIESLPEDSYVRLK